MIQNKILRARRHLLFELRGDELGRATLRETGRDFYTQAVYETHTLEEWERRPVLYIEAEPYNPFGVSWCRVNVSLWFDPIYEPELLLSLLREHGGRRQP